MSAVIEYRVVWKRRGMKRKQKRFASLKAAQRRVLLMGPEPWLALEVLPDDECDCGEHETWREHLLSERKGGRYPVDEGMPSLEFAHIEKRPLGKWELMP